MKLTNKHGLPAPLYTAISRAIAMYEGPRAAEVLSSRTISVTTLINPPRLTLLRAYNEAYLEVDAAELLYMVQGLAFHYMMVAVGFADDSGTVFTEIRETRPFHGWNISGQFDILDGTVLADWKWTSIWSLLTPKFEWDAQLNVYAWLAKSRGLTVDGVRTWAMLRDWSNAKALKDRRLPPIAFADVERPLWKPEVTEAYIAARISVYDEAVRIVNSTGSPNAVPVCTEEERWERKGTSVRCTQYCDVAQFCAFGASLRK
jgi:hypothetical protein